MRPQLNNKVQTEKVENAKPNLSLKMNFAASMLMVINASKELMHITDETGTLDENLCREGTKKFDEMFKDRPYAMRNIALNIYMTNYMPYRDVNSGLFRNFCYFASEMSVIKFIGAVMAARDIDGEAEKLFYYAAARIDRSFAHNNIKVQKVYDMLDTFGITSPAYLMGILR